MSAPSQVRLRDGGVIDVATTADGRVSVVLPAALVLHLSVDEAEAVSRVISYAAGVAVTRRDGQAR